MNAQPVQEVSKAMTALSGAVSPSDAAQPNRPWRPAVEAVAIPVGAVVVALLLFGFFCATQGANPLAVFRAIYKAAFGGWYSFQNTLVRAAPLMLTALCTALPARLGLDIIGNEGALVIGGLGAISAGLALASAPQLVVIAAMALGGMI